jgi:hypothetical protein
LPRCSRTPPCTRRRLFDITKINRNRSTRARREPWHGPRTKQPFAVPLRPDYSAAASNQFRSVQRAITAIAIGAVTQEHYEKILARHWPRDDTAAVILKAAVSISDTTTVTSVPETAVAAFLGGLAPQSAAVRLFERCVRLNFAGVYQYTIPRATTWAAPVFVAEGGPMPILLDVIGNVTVGPTKKMMMGAAVTGELEFYSAESAVAVVKTVMEEQAGRSLDAAVFSTTAGSTLRPAGLLNGVTPFVAVAGGGLAAIVGDLKDLVGAISAANINTDNIVFVSNPKQAIALRLLASPSFNYLVLGTSALADGTVVALAPDAIASGYNGLPTIDVSKNALAHYEDTTPLAIAPSPTPITAPLRSAWQANLLNLRLRMNCAWASLSPGTTTGAVAFVTSTTW